MKHTSPSTSAVAAAQPVNHPPLLKIALDVHPAWHVVALQEDGGGPKPPRSSSPPTYCRGSNSRSPPATASSPATKSAPSATACTASSPPWRDQLRHPPRNWDDQRRRVKTDRTDALALLTALNRFWARNRNALAIVHVPTEAQERSRSQICLRQ